MVGASKDPHPHRRGSNGTGSKPNGAPTMQMLFNSREARTQTNVAAIERNKCFEQPAKFDRSLKEDARAQSTYKLFGLRRGGGVVPTLS